MKSLSMASLALAGLLVSVTSLVPAAAVAQSGSQTVDVNMAATLAARINAEIAKMPADAAVGDIEGAIAYTIGSAGVNYATMNAALSQVAVTSPAVAKALTNVRIAMAEQNGKTAGNGNGNGHGHSYGSDSFASSFSSPAVSVGGGSANYPQKAN